VPDGRLAVRVGDAGMSYAELHRAAGAVASQVAGASRVAVWAVSSLETCVAVVGALAAGVEIVPINPKAGSKELAHILSDSAPELVFCTPGVSVPDAISSRVDVDLSSTGGLPESEPPGEAGAIVVYTSGTTGPPKGVVLPRRAIASNLDALADAWEWTGSDVVAHGLPLFHVHGLILGVLGPLRLGGGAFHLGKFSS
jgi:malonyl-CoA/methylmalonyl-CoA synthetase